MHGGRQAGQGRRRPPAGRPPAAAHLAPPPCTSRQAAMPPAVSLVSTRGSPGRQCRSVLRAPSVYSSRCDSTGDAVLNATGAGMQQRTHLRASSQYRRCSAGLAVASGAACSSAGPARSDRSRSRSNSTCQGGIRRVHGAGQAQAADKRAAGSRQERRWGCASAAAAGMPSGRQGTHSPVPSLIVDTSLAAALSCSWLGRLQMAGWQEGQDGSRSAPGHTSHVGSAASCEEGPAPTGSTPAALPASSAPQAC